MTDIMNRNRNPKLLAVVFGVVLFVLLALSANTTIVQAAPQHGFGRDQGRINSINENDFHTAQWQRFHNNYQFTSGTDHRFSLGRPTTFSGFVPVDVQTANFRRDANVALRPPSYGVFSGHIPTEPSNNLFPQPVNPNFNRNAPLPNPNLDPRFDTTRQGVNAPPVGNPMNIQNAGAGEFLPPTSIIRD